MNLEIFQSSHGDCLLISGANGGRVLCDGGLKKSMKKHLRKRLNWLHEDGEKLDAIYVSHIDQDHISGVLGLLEDLMDWKVYEHHSNQPGGTSVQKPRFPRPPEIGGIWHNAFSDLVSGNVGEIGEMLAAFAPTLSGTGLEEAMHLGYEMSNIATAIPDAMRISQIVKPDLLNIPLNSPPGWHESGQLMMIEDSITPIQIGSLTFHLVGPTGEHLKKLRKGWNNWLNKSSSRDDIEKIRREMARRVQEFANGNLTTTPFDLSSWQGVPGFKGVTPPNTASLMFLVEEEGHTILMTGDSQQDVILEGLKETGHLENGEYIHVDVLKIPHHGSEHNADPDFCQQVSADHYVFCGDGSHGNPEPEVLEMYYESRMGSATKRALAPEAEGRDFTFWFSTTSGYQPPNSTDRRNLQETEEKARRLQAQSGGRMRTMYNYRDWISIRLPFA